MAVIVHLIICRRVVRGFFVAVTIKMMTTFLLDNIILQNLTVLDPESQHQFSPSSGVVMKLFFKIYVISCLFYYNWIQKSQK